MKIIRYVPLVVLAALTMEGCATSNDGRPIPGTLESTSSKNSQNNTPRTNPNPNPEPASNPPGPEGDRRPLPRDY